MGSRSLTFLGLFFFSGWVALVQADLPVHCLRHQVSGSWVVKVSEMNSARSSCGHTHPDNPAAQPDLQLWQTTDAQTEMKLHLMPPDVAVMEDDHNMGTWTMIYDEGFEVKVGSMSLLAFSGYSLEDGNVARNHSHCGQTQLGWIHDSEKNLWGCWMGVKQEGTGEGVVSAGSETQTGSLSVPMSAGGSPENVNVALLSPPESETRKSERYDLPLKKSEHQEFVNRLNNENSGWKAHVYDHLVGQSPRQINARAGIRRHPPSLDQQRGPRDLETAQQHLDQQQQQQVPVQTQSGPQALLSVSSRKVHKRGRKERQEWPSFSLSPSLDVPESEKEAGGQPQPPSSLRGEDPPSPPDSSASIFPDAHIPDVFSSAVGLGGQKGEQLEFGKFPRALDWRDHQGKNWLGPVIDQGDCGSCYVVATVAMLSARRRIVTGNAEEVPFSAAFPLQCAEYNQGCDGGYAYLASKWSADVGLLPESCAPYEEFASCGQLRCDEATLLGTHSQTGGGGAGGGGVWRAKNQRYVGGYYGAASHESIVAALQDGPLVVSLEPKADLMYYKEGVYKSSAERLLGQGTAGAEWERVDHAVLLVGYGVDKETGTKFWVLQNSWGPSWGESGFFRMVRGENDSAIESIAVVADVQMDQKNEVLSSFVQRVNTGQL